MTGFRATGHGFQNTNGGLPASESTASGVLTDSAGGKIYLYVTSVSNQWSLVGSVSQTHSRRQFYPQHLVQDAIVIKGQCPSQHEYDRLVQFIETHHRKALGLTESSSPEYANSMNSGIFSSIFDKSKTNDGKVSGVTFLLLPEDAEESWNHPEVTGQVTIVGGGTEYQVDYDRSTDWSKDKLKKGIYKIPKVHVSGLITEIRAGAQRFVQAPEFEIGLKVIHDFTLLNENRYYDVRRLGGLASRFSQGLGGGFYTEKIKEADSYTDPLWDTIDGIVDGGLEAGQNIVDDALGFVGEVLGGDES